MSDQKRVYDHANNQYVRLYEQWREARAEERTAAPMFGPVWSLSSANEIERHLALVEAAYVALKRLHQQAKQHTAG